LRRNFSNFDAQMALKHANEYSNCCPLASDNLWPHCASASLHLSPLNFHFPLAIFTQRHSPFGQPGGPKGSPRESQRRSRASTSWRRQTGVYDLGGKLLRANKLDHYRSSTIGESLSFSAGQFRPLKRPREKRTKEEDQRRGAGKTREEPQVDWKAPQLFRGAQVCLCVREGEFECARACGFFFCHFSALWAQRDARQSLGRVRCGPLSVYNTV